MAYCCDIERKKLINRINRISGQIKSIKNNIEDINNPFDEDPYEIVRQLATVKGALNGMINSYVEHFAKGHLVEKIKNGDSIEAEAQVDNLLEIIKTFGK